MDSSGPPADAHRVDHTVARAGAVAALCADAAEALAAVRGRARSADGVVTAVVDGGGTLVSLTLTDAVAGLPAARIGPLIVETAHAAGRAALSRREAVLLNLLTDLDR
ncbi:YbaB/EbfC family nucleoid-associated protein [Mycolicibacterium sp. S2-37]|uniref:YbaB/EbfC family nucleoid-associated protein n=1 Tax=Mycolicibacterium sp. S2-37 TaxID=2810297 RepID=UPI001A951304|nr:YbaB/EbfC family nucleoid-associated protein [Mycolicibacterium sp. S2-37]MBO0677785.1 YbaB/EbfC family nucleoid-associated protein [Mycolicibacterium sp. S2-37]